MNSMPKWIVIQLLEHCNLRCKMCYEWGGSGSYHKKEQLHKLDIDTVTLILEEIKESKPYLGLFGGEPLMYPEIERVLQKAASCGISVDIPTNGMLLDKLAPAVVDSGVKRLWISLDGPESVNDRQRGKGVFKQVLSGIEAVIREREKKKKEVTKVGITFIVTPVTWGYIEEFFLRTIDMSMIDHISIEFQSYLTKERFLKYEEYLKEEYNILNPDIARGLITDTSYFSEIDPAAVYEQIKKVRDFCGKKGIYFVTYPKTVDPDNYKNYFNADFMNMQDKKKRCPFPWIYAEINAKGEVTTCHTLYDLTFGNVHKKSLREIWNSREYMKFRKYIRKQLLPICTGCARYYADPQKR